MAFKLTPAEARALLDSDFIREANPDLAGIVPDSPPDAPKPAAAPDTPDMPTVKPRARVHTPTYTLLASVLRLSTDAFGVASIGRVPGGYAIRISERVAYGVRITEPLATVVSLHVRTDGHWHILEHKPMPKLTAHELLTLFVTGKETP